VVNDPTKVDTDEIQIETNEQLGLEDLPEQGQIEQELLGQENDQLIIEDVKSKS